MRRDRIAAGAAPGDPAIGFERASILEDLGRPREAIEALERTIALDRSRLIRALDRLER